MYYNITNCISTLSVEITESNMTSSSK